MRRAGRMHHLKVGAAHARTRVLAIAGGDRLITRVAYVATHDMARQEGVERARTARTTGLPTTGRPFRGTFAAIMGAYSKPCPVGAWAATGTGAR